MGQRVALALGGGGSRALSHLGVLSVLAEAGIQVDAVAGSSLGGVIAALYAFEPDAAAVREKALAYFRGSQLFGMAASQPRDASVAAGPALWDRVRQMTFLTRFFFTLLLRPSLLARSPMQEVVDVLLPDADLADAAIPLACNALNMQDGTLTTFTAGPVRECVLAGTSVASILPLHRFGGAIYADAAPVSAVPVYAARALGADVVIAVDLRAPLLPQPAFHNGFEVFRRIEATSSRLLNDAEVDAADLVIRPHRVVDVFWGDFGIVDTIVAYGEEAAREALPALRQQLCLAESGNSKGAAAAVVTACPAEETKA